jgi:predicted phosphodiesterase
MKYAIISDIHSNLEALTVVLDDISRHKVNKIFCCGDLVGYYANPNECLQLLKKNNVISIAGNHDMAAADADMDISHFWDVARKALLWTRNNITEESQITLQGLPGNLVADNRFLLFHGALHVKEKAECFHLQAEPDVIKSIESLINHESGVKIAFFGHTHRGVAYSYKNNMLSIDKSSTLYLDPDKYYIINPGSVGQQRDGNPKLSYLIYNDKEGTINFYRLKYDVKSCILKARKAGIWQYRWIRRIIRLITRANNRSRRILLNIRTIMLAKK